MLGYFRENVGSWLFKIIIGFVAVLLAIVFGVGGFGPSGRGPVAKVNDHRISFEEYKNSYDLIVNQLRMSAGQNFDEKMIKQFNVKQRALDQLIEEKLISDASAEFDVKVHEKEIVDSVQSASYFQIDNQFNFDKYKRVLANNKMSPEMFEYEQIGRLKQQKVRDLLFDTVLISDIEALTWYQFVNTKVSIDFLKFNPSDYKDISPGNDALKKFYDENRENYKTDEKIKVEYIKFSPEDYEESIEVTEKELNQYYEDNAAMYNTPEKVEARHILIRVDQDADEAKSAEAETEALKIYEMAIDKKNSFADLAKKFSQDSSKANGGHLGTFTKEEMIAPFSEVAFSLNEGDISKPFKTQFGWHIVNVIKKYEPGTKTFEDVKDNIKKTIADKKIGDLAYYDAGDAFDAVVDGDTLQQAALLTKREILTAGPFTENGAGLDFKNNKPFIEAAFSTPVNEISNIVEIENSYFLIKPVEKVKPEIIEFEIVKDIIEKDLKAELQHAKALKVSNDILELTKSNKKLSDIAKEKGLKLNTTEPFDRRGYISEIGYAQNIAQAAFKLSNTGDIHSGVIESNDSFYIISLKEKSVPETFKDEKEKDNIKKTLEAQKKERVYAAWVNNLKAANEVEILIPELFE